MDHQAAHLNNTKLEDRTLWYDGDSSLDGDKLVELAAKYTLAHHIFVDEITPEIQQYNEMVPESDRLRIKEQCDELDFDWNIPEEYKQLDVIKHVFGLIKEKIEGLSEEDINERLERTNYELKLYNKLGLFDVLRTLIYIINKLESDQIVWGVGRGSSVSSYVLYLIGVHDVDSIEYDLDIHDFLKDPQRRQ